MSDGTLKIEVGQDLVRPIIESKIQAAIVGALGEDKDHIIAEIVRTMVNQKVDHTGVINGSSHYNTYPMIEHLAQKAITAAATSAIDDWIQTQKPALREAVAAELGKRKNGLAKAMVDGLGESLKRTWRFNVVCKFNESEK